jgi:hypothetical protein
MRRTLSGAYTGSGGYSGRAGAGGSAHGDGASTYTHSNSDGNALPNRYSGTNCDATANSHTHTATNLYQTPDGDSKAHADTTTYSETHCHAINRRLERALKALGSSYINFYGHRYGFLYPGPIAMV